MLGRITRETVSRSPGFLSSVLHRNTDGTRLTMYARWASLADSEAMRRNPGPKDMLDALMKLARFETERYEVVETLVMS